MRAWLDRTTFVGVSGSGCGAPSRRPHRRRPTRAWRRFRRADTATPNGSSSPTWRASSVRTPSRLPSPARSSIWRSSTAARRASTRPSRSSCAPSRCSTRCRSPAQRALVTPLNSLALVYRAQGLYAQAEPLCRRALAIAEGAHGPEHPAIANVVGNLLTVYLAQGRYGDAAPLFQRSVSDQGTSARTEASRPGRRASATTPRSCARPRTSARRPPGRRAPAIRARPTKRGARREVTEHGSPEPCRCIAGVHDGVPTTLRPSVRSANLIQLPNPTGLVIVSPDPCAGPLPIAVAAVAALILWMLPQWQTQEWNGSLAPRELLDLQNQLRQTLAILLGARRRPGRPGPAVAARRGQRARRAWTPCAWPRTRSARALHARRRPARRRSARGAPRRDLRASSRSPPNRASSTSRRSRSCVPIVRERAAWDPDRPAGAAPADRRPGRADGARPARPHTRTGRRSASICAAPICAAPI